MTADRPATEPRSAVALLRMVATTAARSNREATVPATLIFDALAEAAQGAAPRADDLRECPECSDAMRDMFGAAPRGGHSMPRQPRPQDDPLGHWPTFEESLRQAEADVAAPRAEGLGWPDPKLLANALYRDYDYTVTPEDIRNAYARLSRPSDEGLDGASRGDRCPATHDVAGWCSRDEGHPGAHESRNPRGPGLGAWWNERYTR